MSTINNQNQENCPLCKVVKESTNHVNESEKNQGRRKKPSKFALFILVLLLIGGVFAFYKLSTNISSNLTQVNVIGKEAPVSASSLEAKELENSKQALDFTLKDYQGNEVSLSDVRNKKPVLLIFWATWCGFCAQELPDLKTFHQQHSEEVKILIIVSGENETRVKNYIKDNNINFSILLDKERKVWNQYSARGTPSHFLIGKDGKIITMRPGLASLADLETMLTMTSKE